MTATAHERIAKLEAAVCEFNNAANTDSIVVGWVLYAVTTNTDGAAANTNRYLMACASGQPFHATLGLLESARQDLDRLTHRS